MSIIIKEYSATRYGASDHSRADTILTTWKIYSPFWRGVCKTGIFDGIQTNLFVTSYKKRTLVCQEDFGHNI
jgi:hypothetical protein